MNLLACITLKFTYITFLYYLWKQLTSKLSVEMLKKDQFRFYNTLGGGKYFKGYNFIK